MKKLLLKSFLPVINRVIRTNLGSRLFLRVLKENPDMTIKGAAQLARPEKFNPARLKKENLPETIENFEDLYWLFFNQVSNRGIIKMDFDEASYMFSVIRKNRPQTLLEIGTYMGGSTVLIATAKDKSARFWSIDLRVKHPEYFRDEEVRELVSLVDKENTFLIRGDSKEYIPQEKLDFLFIDGDHSYQGVEGDFNHYLPYLADGADILFHDAVRARDFTSCHKEVNRLVKEIENHTNLTLTKDIGSLRHYKLKNYD